MTSPDQTKHTPTPWRDVEHACSSGSQWSVRIDAGSGIILELVRVCEDREDYNEHAANAAFIVQACNSHEELVEALRELTRVFTVGTLSDPRADAARNALRTYAPEIIAYVESAEAALKKAGVKP